MGREEEIAYAREHGIPVKGGTEAPPYSIDDNLWGRSSEGGTIEDLDQPPRDDVFQLVTRPEEAPDDPELVTVGFERGAPVSIDGERLGLVDLLERAAELGRRHGVGIVDHVEDRIVGLKIRDVYEVPAAAIVLAAHRDLESLVSTIHQNNFKRALEDKWAYLCYAGLWHEPLRTDLDAYMESANEVVTGEVTLKLYKGSVTPVARSSRYALYDRSLASFGESGGEFSQAASPGFIELFTLQTRMARHLREQRQPLSGPEGPSPDQLGENGGKGDDDDLPACRQVHGPVLAREVPAPDPHRRGRCNGGCACGRICDRHQAASRGLKSGGIALIKAARTVAARRIWARGVVPAAHIFLTIRYRPAPTPPSPPGTYPAERGNHWGRAAARQEPRGRVAADGRVAPILRREPAS